MPTIWLCVTPPEDNEWFQAGLQEKAQAGGIDLDVQSFEASNLRRVIDQMNSDSWVVVYAEPLVVDIGHILEILKETPDEKKARIVLITMSTKRRELEQYRSLAQGVLPPPGQFIVGVRHRLESHAREGDVIQIIKSALAAETARPSEEEMREYHRERAAADRAFKERPPAVLPSSEST